MEIGNLNKGKGNISDFDDVGGDDICDKNENEDDSF